MAEEQPVIWTPHAGPQTEALIRPEFEILYGGARGGGKTDAGMAWLLRWIDNPRYRALIIRKNVDDLSDWIDRARNMYRGTGAKFAYKPTVIKFPGGAVFRTGHLKDAASFEKYLGQEYQKMVLEELTIIPQEELYEKLLFSCRSTSPELTPQVFCTTNPGGPGHSWVRKRFMIDDWPWGKPYTYRMKFQGKEVTSSRIFVHAKVEDNPTLTRNDPQYVLRLERLRETNPGLYRAWRFGDWDIPAGQVFSEFRRETHVVDPFKIPEEWRRFIGIDWGVNAPSAVGWYAVNPEGRTYLYREIYMNGVEFQQRYGVPLTPRRMARVIIRINEKNEENYEYAVCDPSMWNKMLGGPRKAQHGEGESIAETMINSGLVLLKGDNDRINGLGRYREMLSKAPDGKPWYQIFANCKDSVRTIPSLTYDLNKVEDVDTDADDHAYDRDRYFFMSRPAPPVLEVSEPRSRIQSHYAKSKRADELGEASAWREWEKD